MISNHVSYERIMMRSYNHALTIGPFTNTNMLADKRHGLKNLPPIILLIFPNQIVINKSILSSPNGTIKEYNIY